MDDVGIGSDKLVRKRSLNRSGGLQDTELQFFDHFRHSINDLDLAPTGQDMFWSMHVHTRIVTASVGKESLRDDWVRLFSALRND